MNVRAAGAVLLMSSALALTACGTTQSAGPATDSASASVGNSASNGSTIVQSDNTGSATSGSGKTGSSTKPPASSANKPAPGLIPCTTDALDAAPGRLESSEYPDKGQGYGYIYMKNTSGKPCLLTGYPKITMQFAGGRPMESHVITDKAPAAVDTTLGAGEWGGFSIAWNTGLDCQTPILLMVTAPDNGGTIPVGANSSSPADRNPLHACNNGTLHVSGWEVGSAPY